METAKRNRLVGVRRSALTDQVREMARESIGPRARLPRWVSALDPDSWYVLVPIRTEGRGRYLVHVSGESQGVPFRGREIHGVPGETLRSLDTINQWIGTLSSLRSEIISAFKRARFDFFLSEDPTLDELAYVLGRIETIRATLGIQDALLRKLGDRKDKTRRSWDIDPYDRSEN
jgi:hypothetical protein